MMKMCQKFNRHYFGPVIISNLGTHLNIAHVNKRNFLRVFLPDSNINSYALCISFRPTACFDRRNPGGIFIKFYARISWKGKSNDFTLILHWKLHTKSFHRDLRTHELWNQFSAHDYFLSRFESIPKLEKLTYVSYVPFKFRVWRTFKYLPTYFVRSV